MSQFNGMGFYFNGIDSEQYGLYLCRVGGENEAQIGFHKSLETEQRQNHQQHLKKVVGKVPTFTLQLVKADQQFNPQELTQDDMYKINTWLFGHNDYKPLISKDNESLIYYGMFVKGTLTRIGDYGYLTVDFELNAPYSYGQMQYFGGRVDGNKTLEIYVRDNINEYIEPDLEFLIDDNQSGFKIDNLTLGETVEYFSLDETCRHGYVYNESLKHMISVSDSDVNLREHSNKKFLKLVRGKNIIKIQGSGTFTIYVQPKIALQ